MKESFELLTPEFLATICERVIEWGDEVETEQLIDETPGIASRNENVSAKARTIMVDNA